MVTDLQKATLGKRLIASIFDGILLSILAVGLAALLALAFGYDKHFATVENAKAKYEAEYGVELMITEEEYEKLDEAKKQSFDAASKALNEDRAVVYAYNMLINLSVLITTFSILISVVLIEFVVPLLFGNGQTVGKKIFGIALMRSDGVKVSALQLFTRAVLGKFAIEIMIPLFVAVMIFFGVMGVSGIFVLFIIAVAEIVCMAVSRTNSLLHDLIAVTVAVDLASQRIFESSEKLLEYKKALHAESVDRAKYTK